MGSEIAVVEGNPQHLIELALNTQATPETLAKLLDLQERWEAANARKAYVRDMAEFKKEAPAAVKKTDTVNFVSAKGRTNYKYANLGNIITEITPILSKHGFSASWETKQAAVEAVTVTCHITHCGGHRESVTLSAPVDTSGNKNSIQAVGSTTTYLQRYTFLAAMGLATTDDDDDGRGYVDKQTGEIKPPAPTTSKPTAKAPQRKEAEPMEAKNTIITGIENITRKDAVNKAGKPYTLYTIYGEDGMKFTTFSDKHASVAKSAKDANLKAVIDYISDKYGHKAEAVDVTDEEYHVDVFATQFAESLLRDPEDNLPF